MERYLLQDKLQIIVFDLDDTLMDRNINQLGKDIIFILQICKNHNKCILLITYNEEAEYFLKFHNIYDYFDSVYIMDKQLPNKNDAFPKILTQYKVEPSNILFIDNCYHHIKEANLINIPSFQINGKKLITISSFINILKLYYQEPLEISINYMSNIDFVIDQNNFHSCSANAMINIFYLCLKKQNNYPLFLCSSLYLYYNTRLLMKTTNIDSGSNYECLFEAIQRFGMIPERLWSLDKDEHLITEPPKHCYEFAKHYKWNFHFHRIENNELSISHALINEFIILATLKRFENQYINDQNFIESDLNSPLKNYFHSIVIVGIDFRKQYVICLNSHGLYYEGTNGFFYISFKDISIVLTDEMYAIDAKFTSINFHSHILDTIQYFENVKTNEIHPISNHSYESINVTIHYDHIIIGSGITGSYLAYKLNELYPNDSILIINENPNHSTVNTFEIENIYIQNTSYRFHLDFNPITFNLAKLFKINISDFPILNDDDNNENKDNNDNKDENNNKYQLITEKLKKDIQSFLKTQDLTSYIENKKLLYDDPYYCSVYFDTFLEMFHYSTIEKETLLLLIQNDSFLTRCPFPIAFYFLLPYLYNNKNWKQLNYNKLISHLQKSFVVGDIYSLLSQTQHRLLLENFYALIHNDQLMIYKRNSSGYQISDSLLLNYNHLYHCSPITPFLNTPLFQLDYNSISRSFIRIYLFVEKPFNNKIYTYNPTLGKIISLSNSILLIDLRIDLTVNLLLSSKPNYIKNGIFYNLNMWPLLQNIILSELIEYLPMAFILFNYNSLLFMTSESVYHKTFLEIIKQQLNKNGNIHWINSNLSFQYCYVEGSLELVDYLLN